MERRIYLCIDLKSFYASVECVERGLDPMKTRLVVADSERTDKSICLAVSPAMKKLGVKNRCRIFEIPKNIEYIMAPPRMQKYIDYAAGIYGVYLKYISEKDIHVYSIDEAFLDVTHYLRMYACEPKELAVRIMDDIEKSIGVRAACGIGTNLYLTKIALDISAKHSDDFIGFLDDEIYRNTLWTHRPLTDFWRIGKGTARKLSQIGIFTMEDIAKADEDLLYRMFGVDAELLIDHAWGREPVTIADIKAYRPKSNCISSGQMLPRNYTFDEGKTIISEMTEALCLKLTEKKLLTEYVSISIGYAGMYHRSRECGSVRLGCGCSESSKIVPETILLYEKTADRDKMIRRIHVIFGNLYKDEGVRQLDFSDVLALKAGKTQERVFDRDKKIQETVIDIKSKFGKNCILKGTDLKEEATARERNLQIGGHKSGRES